MAVIIQCRGETSVFFDCYERNKSVCSELYYSLFSNIFTKYFQDMASCDDFDKLIDETRDWNDLVDEFEALSKDGVDGVDGSIETSSPDDEHENKKILDMIVKKFNEKEEYLEKNLRVKVLIMNILRNAK
ncbi:uncharacterized protein LOC123686469 isoform X1 [Harmonia axyridis]|uniref:uncharacterized protein LOC123686469 isoform X1 n=1 Tax=Harmonia axyridis TaxID=115357 RepID=UPI001E27874E|nr:uncharacterized protein LOC123686469 isoform X1 [Harmonia axyridis]